MAGKLSIKIRDKRLEGEEFAKNRKARKHKPVRHFENTRLVGYYALQHKDRVEYHAQRVAGEERFMRENGISPTTRGSAWKFDKLINQNLKGETK